MLIFLNNLFIIRGKYYAYIHYHHEICEHLTTQQIILTL